MDAQNEFADKWKKILIVYGPFVQSSVVLNRSKLSIFILTFFLMKRKGAVYGLFDRRM